MENDREGGSGDYKTILNDDICVTMWQKSKTYVKFLQNKTVKTN